MKSIRLHLDAHAHIYPFHDVARLLLSALDHMPRIAPTDLRVLLLAERSDCQFFQSLAQDEIQLPAQWRITAWDPDGGVKVRHLPDNRELWILAGRQAATAERIEVCSLFSDDPLKDGAPAREIIRGIVEAGGLAALDWAPGKWLGKRGALVKRLVREFPPNQLALVDTSLRFTGWPAPRLYAQAAKAGRPVLAGSDPLPVPGEESVAGSYHCVFQIPWLADPSRIVEPLRTALTGGNLDIRFGGRRGTPLEVLKRLRSHGKKRNS